MKRITIFAAVSILSFTLFSQQVSEETIVINVEVPVRVFQGSAFVEDLTLSDFEVFEDGVPQRIEAVYLVKKRSIERREENKRFAPETARSFYLFFEVNEYTSKLGEAVDYFVHNVLVPGDNLTIVTPMNTYWLKSQTLEVLSKDEIVKQFKGILRKDALIGSSEYRHMIDELSRLARAISAALATFEQSGEVVMSGTATAVSQNPARYADSLVSSEYDGMSIEEQLQSYVEMLGNLESMRTTDQQKFIEFADLIKDKEGQKYIFMFYEREYIPQVDPKILNQYISLYQDRPTILHTVTGVFDFYRRDINLNVEEIKQAYADSSISIHFLYISKPAEFVYGVRMEEHSEDLFKAFSEMAKATGGFSGSSSDSSFLFRKALDSSENYYLLYYSPLKYQSDGQFREIKVRVKDKNYRVVHRLGYFAR
jgi:hypothetical protein